VPWSANERSSVRTRVRTGAPPPERPRPVMRRTLAPGRAFHLAAGTVHRIRAIEDTVLLEVSTPETEDVVRLEDRYGRADG